MRRLLVLLPAVAVLTWAAPAWADLTPTASTTCVNNNSTVETVWTNPFGQFATVTVWGSSFVVPAHDSRTVVHAFTGSSVPFTVVFQYGSTQQGTLSVPVLTDGCIPTTTIGAPTTTTVFVDLPPVTSLPPVVSVAPPTPIAPPVGEPPQLAITGPVGDVVTWVGFGLVLIGLGGFAVDAVKRERDDA